MEKSGDLRDGGHSPSRLYSPFTDCEPRAAKDPGSEAQSWQPPSPDDVKPQHFVDALEEQDETPYTTPPQNNDSFAHDIWRKQVARLEKRDCAHVDKHVSNKYSQNETRMAEYVPAITSRPDHGDPNTKSVKQAQKANQDDEHQSLVITPLQDRQKHIDPDLARLYSLALSNRWPTNELYHQIAPTAPIFVYCSLMLPWVLAQVIGVAVEEMTSDMVPAVLEGFSRVTVKYALLPTLVPDSKTRSSSEPLQGFLLGSMKERALKKIEEYIDLIDQKRDVVEVDVMTSDGKKVTVAALTYIWNGPLSALEDKRWDPVEYMRNGIIDDSPQPSTSGREVVGLRVDRKK